MESRPQSLHSSPKRCTSLKYVFKLVQIPVACKSGTTTQQVHSSKATVRSQTITYVPQLNNYGHANVASLSLRHNHWMYTYFLVFAKHNFELNTVKIMLHINMCFITKLFVVYNK